MPDAAAKRGCAAKPHLWGTIAAPHGSYIGSAAVYRRGQPRDVPEGQRSDPNRIVSYFQNAKKVPLLITFVCANDELLYLCDSNDAVCAEGGLS